MKRLIFIVTLFSTILSGNATDITLPAPNTEGGMPLMEALANRKSTRSFDTQKRLDLQQLSDLLWAACGFNREDKLTIPTAMNRQEITLYAITPEGTYKYDAKGNKLIEITSENNCELAGVQEYAQKAPLNIAIVSDMEKMSNDIFAAADVGAVMQDIYLWCAANGLGTVARGSFDKEALPKALKLEPSQRILIVQSVGY